MRTLKELRDCIESAIAERNAERLSDCASDLQLRRMRKPAFPPGDLDLILEVIAHPAFHRMTDGPGAFLYELQMDAEKLSAPQRERVIDTLATYYLSFADPVARHFATEIVEKSGDRDALEMFARLDEIGVRASIYLPPGYQYLAADRDVRPLREAFDRLQALLTDPSPHVYREAWLSIERIAEDGAHFAEEARALLAARRERE